MKTFLEWLGQEFTVVRLFDEIDDNQDSSRRFVPKEPSYHILCSGSPEVVKNKFRSGSEDEIKIHETDSEISRSAIAEILMDKFGLTRSQTKNLKVNQIDALTNRGDFVSFLESNTPSHTAPPPQSPTRKIQSWRQGGWKIHLRTGSDPRNRDRAYQIVLNLVAKNGNRWGHKKLHGGEPDEKDITIYCGPMQEAVLAARAINSSRELKSLLLPPGREIMEDDIELLPGSGVHGRFDTKNLNTSPYEFAQYGCRGWPMLVDDVNKKLWDKKNFDNSSSCERSYRALAELFGREFTG